MKRNQLFYKWNVNNGELNIRIEIKKVKIKDIKMNFKEEFKQIEK